VAKFASRFRSSSHFRHDRQIDSFFCGIVDVQLLSTATVWRTWTPLIVALLPRFVDVNANPSAYALLLPIVLWLERASKCGSRYSRQEDRRADLRQPCSAGSSEESSQCHFEAFRFVTILLEAIVFCIDIVQ
jgi:hypothetical protein